MNRKILGVFAVLLLWSYFGIFQLPYYVWTFALTQNWFTQNGLILFKDVIYHHTQLPLFTLFAMAQFFGNTAEMLRLSSFILLVFFGFGIFLLGRKISDRVGIISLGLFLLTFFPLLQNFNIEEMMASLFCLYATYFYLKFWDKFSPLWAFLSGFFVAFGIMSKQSVGLIIIVFFLSTLWHIFKDQKLIKNTVSGSFYFVFGLVLGVVPFLVYYIVTNSLGDFLYWNIIFNFTIYPKQSTPYALGQGLAASSWLFLSIIPSLYLIITKKISNQYLFPLVLMIICSIFLSTSLLPSFLVYKMLPFYPYPLIIWAILLANFKKTSVKIFAVIGLFLLLPILKSFYMDYLPSDIFNRGLILDYGENEQQVVDWLEENTQEKNQIMNLGHHYVTTLSERLPANKYVYLFPWLVSPFDKSTDDILKNPPEIVIIDWRTFDDFPVLKKWQFIQYVKEKYESVVKYGTYEIFKNKN